MAVHTRSTPAPSTLAPARPPPLARVRAPVGLSVRSALWRLRLVVVAVCLGVAAGAVVHALRPPPAATVPVVVLARGVGAGTTLTAADLVVADVPPGAAPAGALTSTDAAHGHVAAVDLPARLPLTPALLAGTTLSGPPGTVVVAVRLGDPAVAALLEPGLHLDLVAARPEGGDGETVARRALVRPAPAGDEPTGVLAAATGADDGPPVLVAVTPDEAVRIAESSVSSRLVAVVVP